MNYTLTLPKQGMDIIIQALADVPYRVSKPVIDEAMRQFTEQEAAAQKSADAPQEAKAAE
jgi:hypothetical protein